MTKAPPVQGQRSPRWAINTRMVIPCENGEDYLIRRRLIQTPLFGIYVHDLLAPDKEDPHDHPWSFISIILRGGYAEDFYAHPWNQVIGKMSAVTQHWGRFSAHRMGTDSAHRIKSIRPGTVSLILVGPRRRQWGFFTKEGWVPWNEYEAEHRAPAKGVGSSVPGICTCRPIVSQNRAHHAQYCDSRV